MRNLRESTSALVLVFAFGALNCAAFGQGQPLGAASSLPASNDSKPARLSSPNATTLTGLAALPEGFSQLKIAAGFLLSISVYDAGELSGAYRVDSNGDVTLPLIRKVHLGNLTTSQAESLLETSYLKEQILLAPQITVDIVQYAPPMVSILGEVSSPGRIQILAPLNLLDVLTGVGGLTDLAGDVVQVSHPVNGISKIDTYTYAKGDDGESIKYVMIQPGDTITVPRAGIVYVLGAVFRPGGYVMQERGHLDVAQALSMAQGTSRDAKVGAVRVIRREPDGSTLEFPINYTAISKGVEQPMPLKAQDIVYVPVSRGKAIFTNSASILGSTASATIYAIK